MLGYQYSGFSVDAGVCIEADELHLSPLELIERIAALVPPPRAHRHRDFDVLAPNSPLRAAVTALALAAPAQPANAPAEPATTGESSPRIGSAGQCCRTQARSGTTQTSSALPVGGVDHS